jgi:hypothetical protein
MPRPKKTSIDWFPHPVTHGRKMGMIERKYGNDGYAVWFKILEEIGSAQPHAINLSDDIQIELYASRCLVDPAIFMQIIGDLISWGEFNQTVWETRRVLYSAKFIESVSEIFRKRKTPPPSLADILQEFEPLPQPKTSTTTSRVSPDTARGTPPAAHPVTAPTGGAAKRAQIRNYEDLLRLSPLAAAQVLTGDTTERAANTWNKYLRELSSEDPERGERMFRDVLSGLFGEIKAGEVNNPAAMLTKRLKELL